MLFVQRQNFTDKFGSASPNPFRLHFSTHLYISMGR